jgi:hypothetical protein
VDESTLTPEELHKLHVLRRLSGGRESDEELLARIRGESRGEPVEAGAGGKGKRRWWGG